MSGKNLDKIMLRIIILGGLPVAVPCGRLGVNAGVAHRPLPLAPVASSAAGSAPVAPLGR